jgi:hypothetical protein
MPVRWIAIVSIAVTLCAVGALRWCSAPDEAPAQRALATPERAPERPEVPVAAPEPRSPEPELAAAPAPEAEGGAASEPTWDGEGEPSRDFVRARITALVAARHPDRPLSSGQLESAVDTALLQRELQREILALGATITPETSPRFEELQLRALRAIEELSGILELEPADLQTFSADLQKF